MSFTSVSVQATRLNPDGSPASGVISFTLNAEMTNGTESVQPSPIAGVLNADGQLTGQNGLPLALIANNDVGTTPSSPTASYVVTETIDGSELVSYIVIIEHTASIVDQGATFTALSDIVKLSNVLASPAMVGQQLVDATNFPGGTTITAFDPTQNTLTITGPAETTVTEAATIGGAVDLSTLAQYSPAPTVMTFIPFDLGQVTGQVPEWNGTEWVPGSGGAAPPGVMVVRKFPFSYDDAGLNTGKVIYTPNANDVILDGWLEVTTQWDGTSPLFDVLFDGLNGFLSINGVGPFDVTNGDSPYGGLVLQGLAYGFTLSKGAVSLQQAILAADSLSPDVVGPHSVERNMPAKFESATPIKVVVSQDGTIGGADPGSTQGSGVLYLVTATPA